jgi:hypothetical protein
MRSETMNVGAATGLLGSAAGAPLSQTAGAETERTQKDSTARERAVDGQQKSEKAAGIGTTEEDQQASERDADGRRLWEDTGKGKKDAAGAEGGEQERRAKDPTGMSGNSLDLTG